MGSVVVPQCQQNIANVPQASTNSLLPHPRCATVSTPSSSSNDKSRASSGRKGIIGKMEDRSSSIFIPHSVEILAIFWFLQILLCKVYLIIFLIIRRIDHHSFFFLENWNLENGIYPSYSTLVSCIIFLKILVSKIQYSLISQTLLVLVHLAASIRFGNFIRRSVFWILLTARR